MLLASAWNTDRQDEKEMSMLSAHVCRILIKAVVVAALCASAAEAAEVKDFEQYKCKLVLPGEQFKWLDNPGPASLIAAFRDDSGLIVNLIVDKTPDYYSLNESSTKGLDDGITKSGKAEILERTITRFRDVPCYQLHARLAQDNSLFTVRLFVANGYLYQMWLAGSNLPIEERSKLDEVFSAFQFVGTPSVPDPGLTSAYKFGEKMGRIVAYCIVGIIVVLVARWLTRTREKKTS